MYTELTLSKVAFNFHLICRDNLDMFIEYSIIDSELKFILSYIYLLLNLLLDNLLLFVVIYPFVVIYCDCSHSQP